MKKQAYNHKMTGDQQISAEENIASILFNHHHVSISEETAAQLGRDILYVVLREFRPDFFTRTVVKNRK